MAVCSPPRPQHWICVDLDDGPAPAAPLLGPQPRCAAGMISVADYQILLVPFPNFARLFDEINLIIESFLLKTWIVADDRTAGVPKQVNLARFRLQMPVQSSKVNCRAEFSSHNSTVVRADPSAGATPRFPRFSSLLCLSFLGLRMLQP